MKKTQLTVEKFAEACNVSIRTLKYYEQIGLIQPAAVGENGYRLYDMTQIDTISTILLLKDHGLALKEIKALLNQQDLHAQYENIKLQKQLILQKKAQLLQKERLVDDTLGQMENYFQKGTAPFVEEMEERRIEPDYFDFSKASLVMTNYLLDGPKSGVIIDPAQNKPVGLYQSKENGSVTLKGKCLCLYEPCPTGWENAVPRLKEAARAQGYPLSTVYLETIFETADPNLCLTKLIMMIAPQKQAAGDMRARNPAAISA